MGQEVSGASCPPSCPPSCPSSCPPSCPPSGEPPVPEAQIYLFFVYTIFLVDLRFFGRFAGGFGLYHFLLICFINLPFFLAGLALPFFEGNMFGANFDSQTSRYDPVMNFARAWSLKSRKISSWAKRIRKTINWTVEKNKILMIMRSFSLLCYFVF